MGTEDPGGCREVLRIAIPLVLSTASLTIMLFVDRMFLSWHSQSAVAAAIPGGITYFTICCFFLGTAEYVNTIVAQHHGAGDKPACTRAVWQGVFFSAISAPLILGSIPAGHALLGAAGHTHQVQELEREYFSILMIGGTALPFAAAFSSFFSGRGKTLVVMWGNLIGNGLNIALDYILIFGKLGFPEMGIQGAAIGTAITTFIPPLFWAALFLGARYQKTYRTRREFRWDRRLFLILLRFGIPSGLRFFLNLAAFTAFVMTVGRLGELSLAANNIALSIEMFSFLPMVGMSIATATLVGNYIGMGRPAYAERSAYSALRLAMVYSMTFALLFLLVPDLFLSLFVTDEFRGQGQVIVDTGVTLLRLVALYTVFDSMSLIFSGALNGAGDTRFTMLAQTALAWFLFVPSVFLTVEVLEWGIVAAWICLVIHIMLVGTTFFLRFRAGRWRAINMIGK